MVNPGAWLTRRRLAEQALFSGKPTVRVLKLTETIIQGEDVRQVQQALIEAGFDVGADGADGIFGKGMDGAVREFQQQKGLTADGIVGDETRRLLGV